MPCSNFGLIMSPAPTLLNAFTTCELGSSICTFSPSDSFGPVVNAKIPFTGGRSPADLWYRSRSFRSDDPGRPVEHFLHYESLYR